MMKSLLISGAAATTAGPGTQVGGTPDFRGDEFEATGYAANDRGDTSNQFDTTLAAPSALADTLPWANNTAFQAGTDTNLIDTMDDTTYDTTTNAKKAQDDCDGTGFVCDFAELSKMQNGNRNYKPQDFVWKVVDPQQRYVTPANGDTMQQTLNCKVLIQSDTGPGGHSFYVPMGQHNTASTDYCDIEAIRRDFQDDQLYMNDTIHLRGEVARLTNTDAATQDLIGEQFDIICGCNTLLKNEVRMKMTPSATMRYVMASTGSSRQLTVTLRVFTNDKLDTELVYPNPFPDNEANFYFLAHHDKTNDWDARLQVNKCIACSASYADCTMRDGDDAAEEIIFWENCGAILGGPVLEGMYNAGIGSTTLHHGLNAGWMSTGTGVPTGVPSLVGGGWAPSKVNTEDDTTPMETTCPYFAFGISKFRLMDKDSTGMMITCEVTACSAPPCSPCSRRRLNMDRRSLQNTGSAVELGTFINIPPETAGSDGEASSSSSKKRGAFFIALICVIVLCVAAGIFVATRQAKKRQEATKARTVELGNKVEA